MCFLTVKTKILKYKFYKFLVNKKVISKQKLIGFGSADYKTMPANLKSVFNNVVNEDLSYLLPLIKNKTILIWGKQDKDTPIYMAKKLNKYIKNSKLVLLNAGHYSYLQKQFEFANLLKKFMGDNEYF